jgi:hypothetical protein
LKGKELGIPGSVVFSVGGRPKGGERGENDGWKGVRVERK